MLKDLLAYLIGLSQPLPPRPTPTLIALHNDYRTEDVEKFQPAPNRIRESITLTGLDAFVRYVNRFKDDASTIFVVPDLSQLSKNATLATCVLDYHSAKRAYSHEEERGDDPAVDTSVVPGPRWGSHKATLKASPSLAYAKLLEIDGKLLAQDEFARKIEELARFSSSHPAAELVELARTLVLTSKGDFKNFDDEFSGSVDFVYDVQVKASAGSAERRLSVPQQIDFNIALIEGTAPVTVPVKFLYRIPADAGAKIALGVKIIERTWLEADAIAAVATQLATDTGCDVFTGTTA